MIVVATTVAPYVAHDADRCLAWLYGAEHLRAQSDEEVRFFAAIEIDARGLRPFECFLDRLSELGGEHWTFHLDDGAAEYRTENRLRRITLGQNLCRSYALDSGASHLLFMAADCAPPPDTLPKLGALAWPIVGGEVPTYCLSGPPVARHPASRGPFEFPVQQHMATAAFVMLRRDLLRRLHFRYDLDTGMSDDPCLEHDARLLGYETLVRKDCVGRHYPECIGPIEHRYSYEQRLIHQ